MDLNHEWRYVLNPSSGVKDYLKNNLPNEISIENARNVIKLLQDFGKELPAIRCSGLGGVVMIFKNQSTFECFNDGGTHYFRMEKNETSI